MSSVVYGCPGCGRGIEGKAGAQVVCARCDSPAALRPAPEGDLQACLACGCEDLYRHRDFNQKLGILIIAIGAATWIWTGSFWPMIGAAVLDLALFYFIPDVAICYRCKAHHRGFPGLEKTPAFDLELHEHHRFTKAREEGKLPPRQDA